jgi:hypothetical protein
LALGVAASIIGNSLHPSREDPMDNPRVFHEYAQSDGWIAAHLGQFAGYLFAFAGLIVLSQLLTGERTRTTVAAQLGGPAGSRWDRPEGHGRQLGPSRRTTAGGGVWGGRELALG